MSTRLNFLPDERFLNLRASLRERLQKMAGVITPENFSSLLDPRIESVLRDAFQGVGAHEGSIWLPDAERRYLVVAYNSGPNAAHIQGFKQPLTEGIASTALVSEQGFAENEVYRHELHSGLLDNKLGVTTYAMIAVPFYFVSACRGVITCVQLFQVHRKDGVTLPANDVPRGFNLDNLNVLKRSSLLVTELIDYRLLRTTVGLESH
jgi:hypothetical protein